MLRVARRRKRAVAARRDWPLAAGLVLGLAADATWADPPHGHPVAGFGALATRIESSLYRDDRLAGGAHVLLLGGGAAAAAAGAARALRDRPGPRLLLAAGVTWAVVGGTSLRREARAVGALLAADDLPAARRRLRSLCGREAGTLDEAGVARAVVESVAENTSDAVIGPLVWGACLGLPGLVGYRALNTLDAMVGHRSPRYARFGWAAARADDVVNLIPARLTAALSVALAGVCGGSPARAARAWRRDGRRHPSPNAGQVEAAFAGALDRTLGGPVTYASGTEERPRLGAGPVPGLADIDRAVRLSSAVSAAGGALAVAAALGRCPR